MKAKGMQVILVDQATGFDWMSDTVADKVHPSESGAKKMADRWMEALKPIIAERQESDL